MEKGSQLSELCRSGHVAVFLFFPFVSTGWPECLPFTRRSQELRFLSSEKKFSQGCAPKQRRLTYLLQLAAKLGWYNAALFWFPNPFPFDNMKICRKKAEETKTNTESKLARVSSWGFQGRIRVQGFTCTKLLMVLFLGLRPLSRNLTKRQVPVYWMSPPLLVHSPFGSWIQGEPCRKMAVHILLDTVATAQEVSAAYKAYSLIKSMEGWILTHASMASQHNLSCIRSLWLRKLNKLLCHGLAQYFYKMSLITSH